MQKTRCCFHKTKASQFISTSAAWQQPKSDQGHLSPEYRLVLHSCHVGIDSKSWKDNCFSGHLRTAIHASVQFCLGLSELYHSPHLIFTDKFVTKPWACVHTLGNMVNMLKGQSFHLKQLAGCHHEQQLCLVSGTWRVRVHFHSTACRT